MAAKIIFSVCCIFFAIDSQWQPLHHMMIIYLIFCIMSLAALRVFSRLSFQWVAFGFDIFWAIAFTILQDSSPEIASILRAFAVFSAAVRWGFWETLSAGAVNTVTILFRGIPAEIAVLGFPPNTSMGAAALLSISTLAAFAIAYLQR